MVKRKSSRNLHAGPRTPQQSVQQQHQPAWTFYIPPVFLLITLTAIYIRWLDISTIISTNINTSNYFISQTNYTERTRRVLKSTPLIDGHNDLPYLLRIERENKIYDDKVMSGLKKGLLSHTDIPRMRRGLMGGQFWSVYVDCPSTSSTTSSSDPKGILNDEPTWAVRDTLEQIDVTKRFIASFPETFEFCDTASCIQRVFKRGKIASMIGIEGGHQVGNSLANIRQMYDLGVRYITTTHNCDNAFGTAASSVAAGGGANAEDTGLTEGFGREYVREMNRIGMLIDLSHVSHQTMRDILEESEAPVIFSHSSSYAMHPHLRNAPDDVLDILAKKNRGIIMVTFVPMFLVSEPEKATIHDVVDHIQHIVQVTGGWDHIGLGSDFDGLPSVPRGLEDVSMYPALVELLMEKLGATDQEIRKLVGENLIRVWEEAEAVSRRLSTQRKPSEVTWEGRRWERSFCGLPFMFEDSNGTRIKGEGGCP